MANEGKGKFPDVLQRAMRLATARQRKLEIWPLAPTRVRLLS